MDKIGFTTVTFRNLSALEVAQIARDNAVEAIEWGADVHLPYHGLEAVENVKQIQQEFHLQALSYGTYYRLGCKDYEAFTAICQVASELGMKIIRIWQGDLPSKKTDYNLKKQMVEETKRLSEIAAQYHLVIGFEFHNNTNNDNGVSAAAFLQAVNCDNVKTYWQPFGNKKKDTENLRAVLPYLVAVHVFYWSKHGKRYPLKKGIRCWKMWIEMIEQAGKDTPYIMEFVKDDSPAQFSEDLKELRGIFYRLS